MITIEVQPGAQKEKMRNTISSLQELLAGKFGFENVGPEKDFNSRRLGLCVAYASVFGVGFACCDTYQIGQTQIWFFPQQRIEL